MEEVEGETKAEISNDRKIRRRSSLAFARSRSSCARIICSSEDNSKLNENVSPSDVPCSPRPTLMIIGVPPFIEFTLISRTA